MAKPISEVLTQYFSGLAKESRRGDAREETFYPALKTLLEEVAQVLHYSEAQITMLPKRTEAGNPDFRVWLGKNHIVGYIEAKNPTVEDLDSAESSEQLLRYRDVFPNLILTNFCEFRLYRNGKLVDSVRAARPFVLYRLKETPPVERENELTTLFDRFLGFSLPRVFTAESLAVELAKRTRFMRDILAQEVATQENRKKGLLLGFYQAFKKYLISQLIHEEFADLYAQTITYGLFAARTRAENGFSRRIAYDHIPRTIGILRDVFRFISLGDLPAQLEWIVDDIAEVLAVADVAGILDQYYRERKGSDPIVHFYETFLAVYDPEEREQRGVYYTPEPVVSYIVRSLHIILKAAFAKQDGLASAGVTLLDPAAGTMTFVAKACQVAVWEFETRYGSGATEGLLRDQILPNYYGFELMMAPYAIGHLKMGFYLTELGLQLREDERFQLYLTNALEMEELEQTELPGMASLSHESQLASEVKRNTPILVILGNPPYSGHSPNKGRWIKAQIETYKRVDGHPLGEPNPKWLQDDYVKFLRLAQWKIEQAGKGVVGMITNHSYLDNPTFRGMRQSLMGTFDEIRVLDLHGSVQRRETAPSGDPDKNVFDIRQGVAITFLMKLGKPAHKRCEVLHFDLWGNREEKYSWLENNDAETTDWKRLDPISPLYLFVPRDIKASTAYGAFIPITEIFPVHGVGIVTSRDHFAIDSNHDTLKDRINTFLNPALSDDMARTILNLKDNRDWHLGEKRRLIEQDHEWQKKIVPILYRPFDLRWIFYHRHAIDFGREEVMKHLLGGDNLALITARSNKSPHPDHFFCSRWLVEAKCGEATTQSYTFPLYLRPNISSQELFNQDEVLTKTPNISPLLMQALSLALGGGAHPEQIMAYIYAVFYAPAYRENYAAFLKTDFPRVPFTKKKDLFLSLASLGRRLQELHLLQADELERSAARFEGEGDRRVAPTRQKGLWYEEKGERLWINPGQYFHPVSPSVWKYRIGGYAVLERWLKERKGLQLTLTDVRTCCRMVTSIASTLGLQEEIDSLYAEIGGDLVAMPKR